MNTGERATIRFVTTTEHEQTCGAELRNTNKTSASERELCPAPSFPPGKRGPLAEPRQNESGAAFRAVSIEPTIATGDPDRRAACGLLSWSWKSTRSFRRSLPPLLSRRRPAPIRKNTNSPGCFRPFVHPSARQLPPSSVCGCATLAGSP